MKLDRLTSHEIEQLVAPIKQQEFGKSLIDILDKKVNEGTLKGERYKYLAKYIAEYVHEHPVSEYESFAQILAERFEELQTLPTKIGEIKQQHLEIVAKAVVDAAVLTGDIGKIEKLLDEVEKEEKEEMFDLKRIIEVGGDIAKDVIEKFVEKE